MPSFRLTLAYDGTDFAGSQIQPGQRTVQGELVGALARLAGPSVRTTLSGRTDRGVHAVGQVAAVSLPGWRAGSLELGRALAASLPHDLAAASVEVCNPSFHPRFDATWREYRYWIAPGVTDPRLRRYAWTPHAPVDQSRVDQAAAFFTREHDFATFASGGEGVPWSERAGRPRASRRTVYRCECRLVAAWAHVEAPLLEVRVVADGFLPRMVRNMVGALVEIGQGRRDPLWIGELLAAEDRRAGPPAAPAHGLTLWKIGFGPEPVDGW